jgi:hypothetical protein
MDSKKNKPGGMTKNSPIKVGFYDDSLKSLQAVPSGAGATPMYMKESLQREYELKPMWKDHWDRPRHKTSAEEMLQGSYTFNYERKKED